MISTMRPAFLATSPGAARSRVGLGPILAITALAVGLTLGQDASAATPEVAAPTTPQLTLTGSNTAAQRTIVDVGDFDGDGVEDIAVGSPYSTAVGRSDAGRVAILPVTATGTIPLGGDLGLTLDIVGGLRFRIGRELEAVGDVNGDGLADLLIGAPRKGVAGPKTPGSAFVVYGRRAGGTLDLASPPSGYGFEVKGITADAYSSPQGLAAPGDMTGDGLADFALVGGEYVKGGFKYRKGVYLIRGSHGSTDLDLQRLPSNRGLRLVSVPGPAYPAIAAAGRVNGDTRPDLIVSAPQVKVPGYRWPVNSTFVLFTQATLKTVTLPAVGASGFRVSGLDGPGYLTAPIAGLGDVNGDGLSDIGLLSDTGGGGVGDRPTAAVIFGSSSNATVSAASPGARGFVLRSPVSTLANTRMYDTIGAAGDVDGDGHADVALHELNGPFGGGKSGSLLIVPGRAATGALVAGSPFDVDQLTLPALRIRAQASPAGCAAMDFGRTFAFTPSARTGTGRTLVTASLAGDAGCTSKVLAFPPTGN